MRRPNQKRLQKIRENLSEAKADCSPMVEAKDAFDLLIEMDAQAKLLNIACEGFKMITQCEGIMACEVAREVLSRLEDRMKL